MAEESPSVESPQSDHPAAVDAWLDEFLAEYDGSGEALLERLLDGTDVPSPDAVADLDSRLDTIESDLEDRFRALENQRTEELQRLESDIEGMIEDVRDRVVQVKREADAKADAEHGHPDIERRQEQLGAALEELDGSVEALKERVEDQVGAAEQRLDDLGGRLEEHDRRMTILASALLSARSELAELGNRSAASAALDRLKAEANREGVGSAACEDCGDAVDISLLSTPACPHCEAAFTHIEPKSGFFGSNTLATGQPPALEGETIEPDAELADLAADDDGTGPSPSSRDPAEADRDAGDEDADAPAEDGESPKTIDGIGSAYAEQLQAVGVYTVEELAVSDPRPLASRIGVSRNRVEDWVEQARERVDLED